MWHYARGLAFAAKGQLDEAAESARLNEIATSEAGQALAVPTGASLLSIGRGLRYLPVVDSPRIGTCGYEG